MLKKGVFVLLVIIIVFIIPQTYALECLTYEDCEMESCIGTTRMCIEGNCIKSSCLLKDGKALTDQEEQNEGINSIVSLSTKFLFLAGIALIIALLFPMLKLHRKVKIMIGVGFGILTIFFGLYLFGGADIINKIFGHDTSDWDYNKADKEIIELINNENYEVDQIILSSKNIVGGKEYKLKSLRHENSLIILKLNSNSSYKNIGINSEITKQKKINNNNVNYNDYNLYNTYFWNKNNLSFILTGEKDESYNIIKYLLSNETVLTKNNIKKNKETKTTTPPTIKLIKPNIQKFTSNNEIIFQISDNDSLIDEDSIKVTGIIGFSKIDCININNKINCSFNGNLKSGINQMNIYVKDIYQNQMNNNYKILFDNIPWNFTPIYPTEDSFINLAKIHFKLTDEHSGLNHKNISINGININLESCKKDINNIECELDNLLISQGKQTLEIKGYDNVGNYNEIILNYFYDNIRPNIEITQRGFIVSDNFKLKNDSLMLDNRKYKLENCNFIYSKYHCEYSTWIKKFSVMDVAGNSFYLENKKIR
jgi:hypothetical protein